MTASKTKKAADPNKVGLMDWLHSIKVSKTNLMTPDNVNQYDGFMVRRGLGMSIDCVDDAHKAQLLNLPKDIEYQYLLRKITRGFRRDSWAKKTKSDADIDTVKQYYQCGTERAVYYMRFLTSEQIEELRSRMDTGGRRK